MSKYLGDVSAYAYAVSQGYTGTEEEFAELMASYAEVAEEAAESARQAAASATSAGQSATNAAGSASTANTKAGEAATSAQTATTKAGEAATSANNAAGSATTASNAANTATTKASEASQSAANAAASATTANNAADDATAAKTASEAAQTAAETAQGKAEEAAEEATTTVANKADKDGIYPDMTVGSLMSEEYTEEKVPYLYRVSGGGIEVGKVEADEIVGGTVAFNQLAHELNDDGWRKEDGVTVTYADGVATISSTTAGNGLVQRSNSPVVKGHKYLVTADFKADEALNNTRFGASTSSGLFLNVNVSTQWATYSLVGEPLTNVGTLFVYHTGSTYSNLNVRNAMLIDLTQMFGSTIADYIYSLEQSSAGAGVAFFRQMFPNAYYPYNAGELMHVSGVSEHVMGGKNLLPMTLADLKAGNTTGTWNGDVYTRNGVVFTPVANSDGFITEVKANGTASNNAYFRLVPNTFDIPANTIITGCDTNAGNDYCIVTYASDDQTLVGVDTGQGFTYAAEVPNANLYFRVNTGKTVNNVVFRPMLRYVGTDSAYVPYREPYTYPLDSSLTLRGIPKLSNGEIYYDGDTYESDGTVTRKYGIVDLGTLNWSYNTESTPRFAANLSQSAIFVNTATRFNGIVPKYVIDAFNNLYAPTTSQDKTIALYTATRLIIRDDTYTDAATFKTAMSGVYLVYELATPTTETAEPYEEYQHVTNGGTEEYVSTGIVPVGHNTKYYGDIGSKVDKLPSDFSNIIAPTETAFKATRAYTVNDLIIIDNVLYKVTASIASGATITPNTNVQQTTLSALIKALS